jgi:hypothetical protein
MKTYNLTCRKVIKQDTESNTVLSTYWVVIDSNDTKDFPLGLIISSEHTAKQLLREGNKDPGLGPPFLDRDFEEWLNDLSLTSLNNLRIKPRHDLKILSPKNTCRVSLLDEEIPQEYDTFNAICYVEKYTVDEEYDYVFLLISLERRHFTEEYIAVNGKCGDKERTQADHDNKINSLIRDGMSIRESYVQLESLVKNINSKLEELLENMFYSNNSMLNRINNLEVKVVNLEKEEYVKVKDFNVIELFFKGGIKNLFVFFFILLVFKEMFISGPLQHIRLLHLIEGLFNNSLSSSSEPIEQSQ